MRKYISYLLIFILFSVNQCKSSEPEIKDIPTEGMTAEDQKAISSIKKFISYVRYSDKGADFTAKAIDMLDLDYVCNYLIANNMSKLSPAEKAEFKALIGEYVRLNAFPTALKYFAKIDLVYSKPQEKEGLIIVPSTLLYKGSDRIKFSWVVLKSNYKIVDLLNENAVSSMKGNRDSQILPFYQKKGIKGLIEKLKEINSTLAKKF